MAVDINNLPTTAEEVEVDYDNYADAQEFPPPIADGTWTFKPTKVEFDLKDGKNGHGSVLTAIASHDVFNDTGEKIGSITFDRFSDKTFERSNVKVSMMNDQLRAWGDRGRYASKQERAQAVKSHVDAGETFRAVSKREAYCGHKGTSFETKRSENGALISGAEPWNVKGSKIPAGESEVSCPVCHQNARVNARIDRRIPASA